MENNYKLEKEYRVPQETFREAYKSFQKKFVYPKSIIFTVLFLILAADFVYAAVKAPDNRLVYLLIVVCLAFAFREWYNPHRIYRNIMDTVNSMGEPLYRIGIADDHADISTVEEAAEEDSDEAHTGDDDEEEEKELPEETELFPEKSVINFDSGYKLLEYEKYFLLMHGKQMFYILPKEGFSEEELKIVRDTEKSSR